MFIIDVIADDPELDAQVPAEVPPGQGQRHPSAPLLHIQDLRLQGNPTHLYPEAHNIYLELHITNTKFHGICTKTAKRIVIFSGVPVHSSDSISE